MRVIHLNKEYLSDQQISNIRKNYTSLQLREEFERLLKLYFDKRFIIVKNTSRGIADPGLFSEYSVEGLNIRFDGSNKKRMSVQTFLSKKFDKEDLIVGVRSLMDYEPLCNIIEKKGNADEVTKINNATLRREALRIYGIEKFFKDMNAKVVDEDKKNQLLYLKWHKSEEPIMMVKVIDSTTKDVYLIRVPPEMKTVKQAVAWTFGMEEEEYHPVKET
jgi:hypothetical protein